MARGHSSHVWFGTSPGNIPKHSKGEAEHTGGSQNNPYKGVPLVRTIKYFAPRKVAPEVVTLPEGLSRFN